MRVRLGWSLFAVTVLLAVAQVGFLVLAEPPLFSFGTLEEGFPLVTVGAIAASAIGALIVTRYPGHRIGWLFLVGQLGTLVGMTAQAYGSYALTEGAGPAAAGHLALWVSGHLGGTFALTLMALLLLLVPDGHLLSRRWSWAIAATLLGLALHVAGWLTIPPEEVTPDGTDPAEQQLAQVLVLLAVIALFVGLIAGTTSLVIRLRRAEGDERAQLRWVATAAAGLAVSVPLGVVLSLLPGAGSWVSSVTVMVAYLFLPVFTGIAILRFRLYDIDILLNRSIVLTVLTGFVATGYIALVVVFGELDDVSDGDAFWPSLLATVLVALAFQPLRRRVNRLADRLVYGAQAAPYEALAEFSDEVGHSRSLAEMLPRMAEAVGRAVGARHAEVWVDVPGHPSEGAWWPVPSPSAHDHVVPVVDGCETYGGLGVAMPAGRDLRPAEHRLLTDFAAQLAKAFQSFRLEAELADQVDLLAQQGEELERSNRRLVSAEAVERSRFEAAIARDVLPHLGAMPQELAALQSAEPWPRDHVEQLLLRTHTALESLRRLTRGVFPAQLAHRGLGAALTSHAELTGQGEALTMDLSVRGRRFDPQVESVAYFCAVELLRALDDPRLSLVTDERTLSLEARGRAEGRLEPQVEHLRDRAEAAGGGLNVTQTDAMVRVVIELPAGSAAHVEPDATEEVGLEG